MYLTGFADEAANDITGQIKATKALGWENIELRNINGKTIADMDDAEFDNIYTALSENEIKINCFGSPIGNAVALITAPFSDTVSMIKNSIPRMQKLDCKMVRIMSYAVLKDNAPEDQMEKERFMRLREIKKMFDDAGILPLHENCVNYGGMGWNYTQRLLENVPGLKLIFDTGNPVFTDDWSKKKPYPKQSPWEFYSKVKEHIAYVHIKDCRWDSENNVPVFTYPGEGAGDVKRIVADMIESGYNGGFSIEPHIGISYFQNDSGSDDEKRYKSYVEYGRRFMKLLAEIKYQA
jgi:sugar phosphate isomerase/epimerase